MTSDPERFLSSASDSSDLERELLGSLRDVGPKGDEKERVWRGVAARVAAVSVVGASAATATSAAAASGSGTTAAAGSLAGGLLAKVVLLAAMTGGVVGGGYWVAQRFAKTEPAVAPSIAPAGAPTAPRPSRDVAAESKTEPTESPAEIAAPAERSSAKRSAGTPSQMLAAESALLAEARAKLRRGDAVGAEQTLGRLRTEFPVGVLSQEREVLAIEVLAARGDSVSARHRAQRFIQAHPKSPHSETLRRFAETP